MIDLDAKYRPAQCETESDLKIPIWKMKTVFSELQKNRPDIIDEIEMVGREFFKELDYHVYQYMASDRGVGKSDNLTEYLNNQELTIQTHPLWESNIICMLEKLSDGTYILLKYRFLNSREVTNLDNFDEVKRVERKRDNTPGSFVDSNKCLGFNIEHYVTKVSSRDHFVGDFQSIEGLQKFLVDENVRMLLWADMETIPPLSDRFQYFIVTGNYIDD